MKKKFNVSNQELTDLMTKHKDLLPILINPFKPAETRLKDFCLAYLRKIGELEDE
ncbi:hypothetical protein UFOVP1264_69 [uncultured Caudovirales phage]|uniref:Uncharacterized protein n=1 Tax=uncultured Caudovirales phage TaxID=2100421 RepID=A0A6J5RRY4_9CAUD|nr:hypothetical protein UFOVP1264_69 [uncultured Caudovirales phage]